jgi:putative addiction module killer protein
MNIINQTQVFTDWLARLKDQIAKKRIVARIRLAENGSFGDHHFCADGVWEMRIHCGPGYRLYYAQEGSTVYLLLIGGDKQSQDRDIEKAKDLWKSYSKEGSK